MKTHRLIFLPLLVALAQCLAPAVNAASYEPPSPSQPVAIVRYAWHDPDRDRDVPVKIYYPEKGGGPFPIIIFSHGLGGSREGYEYLGQHWAGCGYVSVHLQHLGSDDAVWKNAEGAARMTELAKAAADIRNAVNRVHDVSFAIDETLKLNAAADSPLIGRLDTANIGMAGHSFGGWTTMAIAGQTLGPTAISAADPRVKAAIQMSAPVPRLERERDRAYEKITVPVFHMTGTHDDSPIGDTKAAERRIAFDKMNGADTCLVIFNGADHFAFSGHVFGARKKEQDTQFHPLICAGSTAFWDAYLRGDVGAKEWLYNGGFAKLVGTNGAFEKKQAAK
jgi:predicted dienelactone hydrolase